MKKRVLFYCQPVLGIGHFVRSREIVRSLREFEVCFLNGGGEVSGFDFPSWVEVVNLPALRSDDEFQNLFGDDEQHTLEGVKEVRQNLILSVFERFRPDVLVLELFPFGRRKFAGELIPLLVHARKNRAVTKVVCSLRDILVSKRNQAEFEEAVCTELNEYFDLLLIHSDPELYRLEETFSRVGDIKCETRYTGYVVQTPSPTRTPGGPRLDHGGTFILVSIGGGRTGHELLACSIEAGRRIEKKLPHHMHIITGPHAPEELFKRLQEGTLERSHETIERFTSQFHQYLRRADISISMAGYNTCMDILTTGVRALVYPFTGHGNQEQTIRARKLEELGVVRMIHRNQLEPRRLASEILDCLRQPLVSPPALKLQGAEQTARLLKTLLERGSS